MRARLLTGMVVLAIATGCGDRSSSGKVDAGVNAIDNVYEHRVQDHTWIDPDDSSKPLTAPDNNDGSFATCASCSYEICYEVLPIEHKLEVKSDEDLARMVRWLRSPDSCVRRVAEHLLWPRLGLPGDGMSVSVQDLEGYEFHSIVCALKQHLDVAKIAYRPSLFDGFMVTLTEKDFATIMRGTWQQVSADSDSHQLNLDIDSDAIQVIVKNTKPDPQSKDRAWSSKIEELRVNAKSQFEIIGRAPNQSARHYLFWPINDHLAWLAYSNEGAPLSDISWIKLRKVR